MRKFKTVAAAVTALAISLVPAAVPASEAAAGDSHTGEAVIDVSADGSEYQFDLVLDKDADGSFVGNISAEISNSSDTGGTYTFASTDLIRYIDDTETLYVNMDEINTIYQDITGSADLTAVYTALGISGSWIEVPLADFEELGDLDNDEVIDDLEASDSLKMDIREALAPIAVYTDSSFSATFDNDSLIQTADNLDTVIADHKDELKSLTRKYYDSMNSASTQESTNQAEEIILNAFKPYVEAYAEGYASVTGDNQEELASSLMEELRSQIDVSMSASFSDSNGSSITPEEFWDEITDLSEQLSADLEEQGLTLSGTANGSSSDDGGSFDFSLTASGAESEVNVNCSVSYDETVLSDTSVEVPESATPLTDVARTIGLYVGYSDASEEETTAAAE